MNLLAVFLILPLITAFSFNPMSQTLRLGENQKSIQFKVENNTTNKVAIDLSIKSRHVNENGVEVLSETDDLVIFPPQLILPPGEKRTVRVNWLGSNNVNSEKAYRVIAEQLPLQVEGKKYKEPSGINMLMKYLASLYITPNSAEAKLKVLAVKNSGSELKIKVRNEGTKHQILTNPVLVLGEGKRKIILKGKELEGMAGENILAGKDRTFILKSLDSKYSTTPAAIIIDG